MPKVRIVCQHCGKVVVRKINPSRKDAGKYCSRECAFQVAGILKAERIRKITWRVVAETAIIKNLTKYPRVWLEFRGFAIA